MDFALKALNLALVYGPILAEKVPQMIQLVELGLEVLKQDHPPTAAQAAVLIKLEHDLRAQLHKPR